MEFIYLLFEFTSIYLGRRAYHPSRAYNYIPMDGYMFHEHSLGMRNIEYSSYPTSLPCT